MYPNPYIKPSLFGSGGLLKSIKWGSILDGTQKTLGVINQAIPIVYQVKPMVNNMRSVFKIANAINTPDVNVPTNTNNNVQPSNNTVSSTNNNYSNSNSSSKPVFYL